jgi:hypothetical protein
MLSLPRKKGIERLLLEVGRHQNLNVATHFS